MEFEENDSSGSGSPVESESPPSQPLGVGGGGGGGGEVLPQVMNTAVNMSLERSLGVPVAGAGVNHGNNRGSGVMSGGSGGEGGGIVMVEKKKRGRPRKYDSNGNLSAAYKIAAAARGGGADAAATATAATPQGFTLTSPLTSQYSSPGKRGRGRVRGTGRVIDSGNLQHLSPLGEQRVNTAGEDFTPHIVTVYTGEDVAGKILSFAQKGTRGVCVLSANGSVSNATIRQPASSGGILTYEGRFEILTLTGSYTVSDNGGMKSRTGGLSVSLAGPDGRVIGGGVAGMLIAASPIQIVVGSFMTNSDKMQQQQRKQTPEPRSTPHVQQVSLNPVPLSAPPHHMSMPRSAPLSSPQGNMFPTPASQLPAQNRVEADNSRSNNPSSLSTESAHWNGSERSADQWPTPDINLSAPMEQQ